VTNGGLASGTADTPIPDPHAPICFGDCFVSHTFLWKDDVLIDLGALPGINSSGQNWMNASGVVTGISQNAAIDPLTGGPEFRAVVWKDGEIIDLGTFGGNWSYANAINDAGQVVGFALNTTPDSFDLGDLCENFPFKTQMRAFIWKDGVLRNLGTLGGTDSCALWVNQRGEAGGHSFTNAIVNPVTGIPTVHPFLWDGHRLLDLGTLGGTLGTTSDINNRGEVVGLSTLAGDLTFHPFLWDRETLTDLGTFGGDNGQANSVNDAGEVVGKADLPGPVPQTHDGFLWKNGVMTDLGTQDGDACSNALSINSKGQVVGGSSDCFTFLHAFLWEHGGPMIDLNTFVPPGSDLTLTEATFISDRGEIAVNGTLPNGDTHAVLLVPCGEGTEGCRDAAESTTAATQSNVLPVSRNSTSLTQGNPPLNGRPSGMLDRFRPRLTDLYNVPGHGTGPRN
jgi:probable HAF family extracellular repeat protein